MGCNSGHWLAYSKPSTKMKSFAVNASRSDWEPLNSSRSTEPVMPLTEPENEYCHTIHEVLGSLSVRSSS